MSSDSMWYSKKKPLIKFTAIRDPYLLYSFSLTSYSNNDLVQFCSSRMTAQCNSLDIVYPCSLPGLTLVICTRGGTCEIYSDSKRDRQQNSNFKNSLLLYHEYIYLISSTLFGQLLCLLWSFDKHFLQLFVFQCSSTPSLITLIEQLVIF